MHAEQWSQVWPTIEDFRFLTDQLIVQVSPDRLQAVVIVSWASTGIGADGTRFDRPGRATVVLRRATPSTRRGSAPTPTSRSGAACRTARTARPRA